MLRAGGTTAHHGRYLFFFTLAGLLAVAGEAWAEDAPAKKAAHAVKPAALSAISPAGSLVDPAKAEIRKNLFMSHADARTPVMKSVVKIHPAPDVEFTTAMRHLANIPLNAEERKTPLSLVFHGRTLSLSIGW